MEDKKSIDIEFYKDWMITILQFMSDQYSNNEHYRGQNYHCFFQSKIEAIENGYENKNIRGIKLAYRDVNQLALYEAKNLKQLNMLLKEKFNKSLTEEKDLIEKAMAKILKRGQINNDEEYYLVKDYIDESIIENQTDDF